MGLKYIKQGEKYKRNIMQKKLMAFRKGSMYIKQ